MKPDETAQKKQTHGQPFTKVLDGRKHPVRGLWRRGGRYYAQISVELDSGAKAVRRVPLDKITTDAKAIEAYRMLLVDRSRNQMPHIGQTPKFEDYLPTYLARLELSGKKPDTTHSYLE